MPSHEIKPTLTASENDALGAFHSAFNDTLDTQWPGYRVNGQMHSHQYSCSLTLAEIMQAQDWDELARDKAMSIINRAIHDGCQNLAYGVMKPSNGFLRSEVITFGNCESKLIAAYALHEEIVVVQLIVGFGE